MLDMNNIEEFYEQIQNDVVSEAQGLITDDGSVGDFKENAFTRLIIDDLEAAGVLESPVACYYEHAAGNAVMKVNAFSIPEEDTRLELVVTAYFADPNPRRMTAADLERLLNMTVRYFRAATKGHYKQLDPGSEAYAMSRSIFDSKEEFDRVHVILVTNGIAAQRRELSNKDKIESWSVSYDLWDLERLRRFRSSGATHEPIFADLSKIDGGGVRCVSIADELGGYKTCVAIFPGAVLHDWYDEYGSRMLELNVRSYLQARGKVNAGILETIIKDPARFLAYNNGITIVAEEVKFNKDSDRILSIQGLQIVNGGQTTASIHRAKKELHADLGGVYVQAKITVVPSEVFESVVPDISRYSNTQNKVTEVDLGANHPFHVGVERVALNTWTPGEQSMWFYERARGSYQTQRARAGSGKSAKGKFDRRYPASQRFSKEDLARYWNTWNGDAHTVNRGGQKNFVRFMESLPKVEKDWEPSREEFREIAAIAILFKSVQEVAKQRKISSFRINTVIYTVALLAEKTARRLDLQAIWNQQKVSDELAQLIGDWLEQVAVILRQSAGNRNPGEWFKQENCWRQLKDATASWVVPQDVSAQLRKVDGVEQVLPDSVQNEIAQCIQVDATTWFKIQLWGGQTGKLEKWQIGIANTLSGYAANGWERKPSVKQARQAVKILEAYRNDDGQSLA